MAVDGVSLDTSYFTAGGGGRRPAVLIGHGSGFEADVKGQPRSSHATVTRPDLVGAWIRQVDGKIGLKIPRAR